VLAAPQNKMAAPNANATILLMVIVSSSLRIGLNRHQRTIIYTFHQVHDETAAIRDSKIENCERD
jgi:hypothetical protein